MHIVIFVLCFHPATIKSFTVYGYIMDFFPFLFSVENVCPLCHKSFKKNYLMKKHFELIHEGKKSYQCHQCAHLFATKAGLIHHQQHVHEGIKFHCQVCRNNYTKSCKDSVIGFFSNLEYTSLIGSLDTISQSCTYCNKK